MDKDDKKYLLKKCDELKNVLKSFDKLDQELTFDCLKDDTLMEIRILADKLEWWNNKTNNIYLNKEVEELANWGNDVDYDTPMGLLKLKDAVAEMTELKIIIKNICDISKRIMKEK